MPAARGGPKGFSQNAKGRDEIRLSSMGGVFFLLCVQLWSSPAARAAPGVGERRREMLTSSNQLLRFLKAFGAEIAAPLRCSHYPGRHKADASPRGVEIKCKILNFCRKRKKGSSFFRLTSFFPLVPGSIQAMQSLISEHQQPCRSGFCRALGALCDALGTPSPAVFPAPGTARPCHSTAWHKAGH